MKLIIIGFLVLTVLNARSFGVEIDADVQNQSFELKGCVNSEGFFVNWSRTDGDKLCIGDTVLLPTSGCQSGGFETKVVGINSTDVALGFSGSGQKASYLISLATIFNSNCPYEIIRN